MSSREEKIARNEALFREVNERIKDVREDTEPSGTPDSRDAYLCECGDDDCVEEIRLTADEYEAVRADPRQFAIVPGHAIRDVERIVRHGNGFEVVQKHAEEAEIAEQMDPRA